MLIMIVDYDCWLWLLIMIVDYDCWYIYSLEKNSLRKIVIWNKTNELLYLILLDNHLWKWLTKIFCHCHVISCGWLKNFLTKEGLIIIQMMIIVIKNNNSDKMIMTIMILNSIQSTKMCMSFVMLYVKFGYEIWIHKKAILHY